jgi:hypothetical protein
VAREDETQPAAPDEDDEGRLKGGSVLDNIEYVVMLMEDRSFDSMVGWLYKDGQPSKFVGADQTPTYRAYRRAAIPTSTTRR